ncbi:hypothetical protein [Flavobacterium sp.]|uniref:hypothetical protein n=1 Tax=Flavobacterium sp. TaxID=239 RepID=UPI002B4B58D0|nr:hypothetical protein [Flavobacterium sp.]HLP64400.1 hypothetical protein [Flavobacterium sp.]
MNIIKKFKIVFIFSLLIFGVCSLFLSCSKDEATEPTYTCAACTRTPDALPANDTSAKGIYKGIVVGSSGTLSINIQNGSSAITGTLVIDGVAVALTSSVTYVDGQPYLAPFTGTYNNSPISITFSVAVGGGTPTVISSDIPGHPNAVFTIAKETSTSLIEAFEGTYSKSGETGIFNIILSSGLGAWGGIAKENGSSVVEDISGTYINNQVIDENGTVVGVITGDVLQGSFTDSSNTIVTTIGYRTL